jgi:hypothetical protein
MVGGAEMKDVTMRETKQNAEEVRQLTAAERSAVSKYLARSEAKPSVRFKVSNDAGGTKIEPDHANEAIGHVLFMNALGSADYAFADGIKRQLANASSNGKETIEGDLNFLVSVIKGIEPRDQLEAMLAAQMAVIHVASMTFARRLANVENIHQQDSAERAFNKLVRTFAVQMEALKRYRAGGEQKVPIENISAAEGGQAGGGNGTQAVRASGDKNVATSPPPSSNETNVVPMKLDKTKERTRAAGRRKPAA